MHEVGQRVRIKNNISWPGSRTGTVQGYFRLEGKTVCEVLHDQPQRLGDTTTRNLLWYPDELEGVSPKNTRNE